MAAESLDAMQQLIDLENPFQELQAVKEKEKDILMLMSLNMNGSIEY